MSIIQELDSLLKPLRITLYPNYYFSKDKSEYGYYDGITDTFEQFADDESNEYVESCSVHLFLRSEIQAKKQKLKEILKNSELCVSDIYEQYETNTGYTHITVAVETISTDFYNKEE